MMTKDQLRQQYLAMRRAMTDSPQKSRIIAKRLFVDGKPQWNHVFCYLSFANEVDTAGIIQQMLEWGIQVSVPVCDPVTCTMTPSLISSLANCKKNTYGILEPINTVHPDIPLDAALIPGVVFSRDGHRIGFGKGYYDRFLSGLDKQPLKIGLCYDWQLTEHLPHQSHDITMDRIITDERMLQI